MRTIWMEIILNIAIDRTCWYFVMSFGGSDHILIHIHRLRRCGRFYNRVTPTSDVLGIVSMSNRVYSRKTRSVPNIFYFIYFYTSSLKEAIKKYQMLFLVLATVHGRLSQQRLNLDLKKMEDGKTVKKTAQKGQMLIVRLYYNGVG